MPANGIAQITDKSPPSRWGAKCPLDAAKTNPGKKDRNVKIIQVNDIEDLKNLN